MANKRDLSFHKEGGQAQKKENKLIAQRRGKVTDLVLVLPPRGSSKVEIGSRCQANDSANYDLGRPKEIEILTRMQVVLLTGPQGSVQGEEAP